MRKRDKRALKRRIKACEFAAHLLATWDNEDGICPRLWSATVFFESYMTKGATHTMKDFGPKKPKKLKLVSG